MVPVPVMLTVPPRMEPPGLVPSLSACNTTLPVETVRVAVTLTLFEAIALMLPVVVVMAASRLMSLRALALALPVSW